MKIACQSCPAKYTIADDKVVGKIVKIRCKKCNATIVVNGNEAGAAADEGATALYQGSQDDVWTVNVAEGDQRTMSTAEVIDAHRAGVVNDETYLGKGGIVGGRRISEVEAFTGSLAASEIGGGDFGGLADLGYDEPNDERTLAAPAGVINAAIAAMGNVPSPLGSSAPAPAAGTPAAARRAGGRGAGGDLFGSAASAGAEDGVLTSAGAAKDPLADAASSSAADDKLTGQRNENSVLFSLGSLTGGSSPKPVENKTTAEGDASGLIDIRALAASMGTDSSKSSNKVDDIMNLGGGGAFGAAMAAPVLTAPPLEANPLLAAPALAEPAAQKGGGKGLMFGLLGLGVAIVAAAIVVLKKDPPPTVPTAVATGTAAPTTGAGSSSGGSSGAVATNDNTSGAIDPTKGPAPVGGSSGAAGSSGKATGSSGAATGSSGTAAASSGGAATATTATTTAAPAPTKPLSLEEQMRQSASGGTGSSGGSSSGGAGAGPFDRGAAAAALGAIAGSVGSCKKADGPTGAGHVTVTFAPNGSVKAAVADSAPYQGTPVGGCVAGKFRGAHIPPFSGSDQAVGKSFSIN